MEKNRNNLKKYLIGLVVVAIVVTIGFTSAPESTDELVGNIRSKGMSVEQIDAKQLQQMYFDKTGKKLSEIQLKKLMKRLKKVDAKDKKRKIKKKRNVRERVPKSQKIKGKIPVEKKVQSSQSASTLQICGDGVVQSPEQCDDGNANDGDGCSFVCELEVVTLLGGGGGGEPAPATSNVTVDVSFKAIMTADYQDILVPGSDYEVARFEIHPVNGAATLTSFVVTTDDNMVDNSDRFGTFYLTDEDDVVLDTAAMFDAQQSDGDGTITFDGFSYSIDNFDYAVLKVKADVLSINDATETGAFLNLYLASTSSTDIELEDINGDTIPAANITNDAEDGDNYQQFHVTRKSQPFVSYDNGNIVSMMVDATETDREIYRFEVEALGDSVEVSRFTFNAESSANMNASNFILYNAVAAGPDFRLNSTPANIVGGEVVINVDNGDFTRILGGSSETYYLLADLSAPNATQSETLSVELTAGDDLTFITESQAAMGPMYDFVWSDRSGYVMGQLHDLNIADRTNGYLVEDLDVETVNIGYQGVGN